MNLRPTVSSYRAVRRRLGRQPPTAPAEIFALGCPLLGICYGMQTMVAQLGGKVENAARHEYGQAQVTVTADDELLGDAGAAISVWMSHGDRVTALPAGFQIIAASDNSPYAAIADSARHYYGVQFHPEVTHTVGGREILARFVHEICGCGRHWTAANIIDDSVQEIARKSRRRRRHSRLIRRRRFVGNRRVITPRNRRATDLHLRRHRLVAIERRRFGDGNFRRKSRRQCYPR